MLVRVQLPAHVRYSGLDVRLRPGHRVGVVGPGAGLLHRNMFVEPDERPTIVGYLEICWRASTRPDDDAPARLVIDPVNPDACDELWHVDGDGAARRPSEEQ